MRVIWSVVCGSLLSWFGRNRCGLVPLVGNFKLAGDPFHIVHVTYAVVVAAAPVHPSSE